MSTSRSGGCWFVLAAELADIVLDDGAVSVSLAGGFFPPSLKPDSLSDLRASRSSSCVTKLIISALGAMPVKAFTVLVSIPSKPEDSLVGRSIQFEGNRVRQQGEIRRFYQPKVKTNNTVPADDQDGWTGSEAIFIAIGWSQKASCFGQTRHCQQEVAFLSLYNHEHKSRETALKKTDTICIEQETL
jgi:hypothetical protein